MTTKRPKTLKNKNNGQKATSFNGWLIPGLPEPKIPSYWKIFIGILVVIMAIGFSLGLFVMAMVTT